MSHLSSSLSLATITLKSLKTELTRKGLRATIDSLPPLSDITIEPQHYCESEHAYEIFIGQRADQDVWAVLGRKPVSAETKGAAPGMIFFVERKTVGPFKNLESVDMVEPFRSLWYKTRDLPDKGATRAGWDLRRGCFKTLVYWYYLQDAAERNVVFRFPETIRKAYVEKAFLRMAREELESDLAEDIAATLGRLAVHTKEQEEVEKWLQEQARNNIDEGTHAESVKRVAKGGDDDMKRQEAIKALEKQLRQLRKSEDRQSGTRSLSPTLHAAHPSKRCMSTERTQPRKRPALTEALEDSKRKQPRMGEESESEDQPTDVDTSVQTSIKKREYQRSRSRCHQLYTSTPDAWTGSHADHAGSDSSEHKTILQKFQRSIEKANGRSDSAPIYKMDTLDKSRTPIVRQEIGPLAWDDHPRGYTPLLPASQQNLQSPVHPCNLPSTLLSTSTVPKVSSPPPPSFPTSNTTTNLELIELTPAQYIEGMKKAIYKTEEINADLTNIEQEEIELKKVKEKLEERRKKAKEALQLNHFVIKYIAEGLVIGGKVGEDEKVAENRT